MLHFKQQKLLQSLTKSKVGLATNLLGSRSNHCTLRKSADRRRKRGFTSLVKDLVYYSAGFLRLKDLALCQQGFTWQEMQQQVPQVFCKTEAGVNPGESGQGVSGGKRQNTILSASAKPHQETQNKPNLKDTWDFRTSDYFWDTNAAVKHTQTTSPNICVLNTMAKSGRIPVPKYFVTT